MSITMPYNIVAGTLVDATTVEANFTEIETKATDKTGDTLSGTMNTQHLLPNIDDTYDLGTANLRYRNLYLSGTITGPGANLTFKTIAVSGQSDVVADTSTDTLTLVNGTGITITTNAGADSVTVTASGAAVVGTSNISSLGAGTIYTYQSGTGTGNVTTGEDTLYSKSIPANVLATDGDSLYISLYGLLANNANSKVFRVKFGATTLLTTSSNPSSDISWVITGEITRTSATTQVSMFQVKGYTLSTADASGLTVTTSAETLSGAVTFLVTGEGVDTNDLILKSARIEYHPHAPQ